MLLANPKHGKFDKYKSITEQIKVIPPLLSRCDLVLVIQDNLNKEKYRKIAESILNKFSNSDSKKIENKGILNNNTLKKYLKYATTFKPKLSEESIKYLNDYFC